MSYRGGGGGELLIQQSASKGRHHRIDSETWARSCNLVATGYSLLTIGHRLLATHYWLLAAGCFSSAAPSHFAQFAAASYVLSKKLSSAASGSADCRIASYGKINSPKLLSNLAPAGVIA